MFLKNCWYCAGWDQDVSHSKGALVKRRIAGEDIVLWRRLDGAVVAMQDRCPHRQAALSLGVKEGNGLRCLYHGMLFGPDGRCTEIPGQSRIPTNAVVRCFPVVERNNWIWLWMGDPADADPNLICFAVGPGDPGWNIKTSRVCVETNYRLEIANLMDLSHITWTHRKTFGGTDAYAINRPQHTTTARGVNSIFWLHGVPAPVFAQHLFPLGMLFDLNFDVQFSVPCNFILHFRVWTAGTTKNGSSNGELVLDSYSCQAVTPRDEDSVDYYYSWGPSLATDGPGMSDMMKEAVDAAFLEDKATLEAQYQNMKRKSGGGSRVDLLIDAGPSKMLWVLDKMLRAEAGMSTPDPAEPLGLSVEV